MARQDERMSYLFLVNMTQVLEPVVLSLTAASSFPPSFPRHLRHIRRYKVFSTDIELPWKGPVAVAAAARSLQS